MLRFSSWTIAHSRNGARVGAEQPAPELCDLRIELLDAQGYARPGACYAKVIESAPDAFTIRFTSRSRALDEALPS